MANLKEYVLGDYLKADEVTKGDVAVIITTPELVDKTYQGRTEKKLEGRVEFKGKQRMLSWNKTNAKACSNSWGEETQNWLGKVISLDVANQLISGSMKKVLLILPKEEIVQPDWVTEEMIQGKISLCSGLIDRDAAIRILMKEKEVRKGQ
jgi:hypothetical protein